MNNKESGRHEKKGSNEKHIQRMRDAVCHVNPSLGIGGRGSRQEMITSQDKDNLHEKMNYGSPKTVTKKQETEA